MAFNGCSQEKTGGLGAVPLSYPSHQGLIAPIWRRWPNAFDMPALCVGATLPDAVDGLFALYRGHLGQSWGHTLVGMIGLGIPLGLLLWAGLHYFARAVPRFRGAHLLARFWNDGNDAIAGSPGPETIRRRWRIVLWSLFIGGLSHLFFDLLSHGKKHAGFQLFRPLEVDIQVYPDWWNHTWFLMPVPGYGDGYPFAPHFLAWCALNLVGALMLIWPVWRGKPQPETE